MLSNRPEINEVHSGLNFRTKIAFEKKYLHRRNQPRIRTTVGADFMAADFVPFGGDSLGGKFNEQFKGEKKN